MSLVPGWRATPLVRADAISYVKLANNLLAHGVFSSETNPPYLWEPNRTPGYPALIALSMRFLSGAQWALYWATITAGLAGWCIVRLTEHWGGGVLAQHWAGLCMAFLPNSLGLSAELLTDAVFGHLVIFWIFTLLMGLSNQSFLTLGGSAILLCLLQAIKPTMNIAAVIIIGVALISVRQGKMWIMIGVLVLLSLPVPGYFAVRNLNDHGVFSPTLLGVETMREYLQIRSLQETSHQDFRALTAQVAREDRLAAESLSSSQSFNGRLYLVQRAKVEQFVRENPLSTIRLMVTEMMRQFLAPSEYCFQVFLGELPTWGRALGSALTLVLWTATFLGALFFWKRGEWLPGLLFLGVLGFFLITGSISHFVGARLRFPADLVALPLASFGFSQLISSRLFSPFA